MTTRSTFASALPSSHRTASLTRRAVVIISATLVVALAAHLALPLPFTPVPLTLQPLAVLVIGLLLGPVEGGLAMLAYLLEGAAGLPVFSPTGPGGLLQLFGPTGGFLLAYPAVAFCSGAVVRSLKKPLPAYPAALLAAMAGTVLLFLAGAGWLHHLTGLGGHALMTAAVLPFLPGEAIKIAIAAGLYRALCPLTSR